MGFLVRPPTNFGNLKLTIIIYCQNHICGALLTPGEFTYYNQALGSYQLPGLDGLQMPHGQLFFCLVLQRREASLYEGCDSYYQNIKVEII